MDILRQDTDYALRAMVNLAGREKAEAVSVRTLAEQEDISYQFACKIMQKLQGAGLVKSAMGPKGGYFLARDAEQINLAEVIEAVQGRVNLNKCLLGVEYCPRRPVCPVSRKLEELQEQIENFLAGISLAELAESRGKLVRQAQTS